jgi:hypothetical protein
VKISSRRHEETVLEGGDQRGDDQRDSRASMAMGREQGDRGEQGAAKELYSELGAGSAVLGAGLGQRGRRGAMGIGKSELGLDADSGGRSTALG